MLCWNRRSVNANLSVITATPCKNLTVLCTCQGVMETGTNLADSVISQFIYHRRRADVKVVVIRG